MSNANKGLGALLFTLVDIIRSIFRQKPATPPQPVILPDNTTEPARMVSARVLLIVYDPVMNPSSGERLSQIMHWKKVDDLVAGFLADINGASKGLARFQIVERVELLEFSSLMDGFRYTPDTYMDVMRGGRPHEPRDVDYLAILTGFNILERIANREIDEVWVFGFPYAGFYESIMGGAGAFWCNAPPLPKTSSCNRKFLIMGFSFERGVGEMLESFGHRVESIMEKTFSKVEGDANLYQRFTRYDQKFPGQAEVGTIHFAPNGEKDYDWNNQRTVPSCCDDWFNFPTFQGTIKDVTATEWGNGEMRLHHRWWLNHLPKVAGRTSGVANNWWQYVMDPNLVIL